jgi:hypothetical protein
MKQLSQGNESFLIQGFRLFCDAACNYGGCILANSTHYHCNVCGFAVTQVGFAVSRYFYDHKFTLVLICTRWRNARRTKLRVLGQISMLWDAVTTQCTHRRHRVRAIAQPSTQCTASLRQQDLRRFHLALGLHPTTAPSQRSSVLFTLRPQILTASPDSRMTLGSVH